MERVMNQDERIRRAEEIYARRQNLRNKTKKATLNVSEEPSKSAKVVKKIGLQIIICVMIYYIFHLINTTNYDFSENVLNKANEIVSFNYDFYGLYDSAYHYVQGIISNLESKENNDDEQINEEENQEENNIEEQMENQEEKQEEIQTGEINQNEQIQIAENNEESLTQTEIPETNLSETDRIKAKYSFLVPVSRNNFF